MIKTSVTEDAKILSELAIQMWEDNYTDELTEEFRELIKN